MNLKKYGFARPVNSKKFHIFYEGRSLCNGWMFFGSTVEANGKETPITEDCKSCFTKYKKLLETK